MRCGLKSFRVPHDEHLNTSPLLPLLALIVVPASLKSPPRVGCRPVVEPTGLAQPAHGASRADFRRSGGTYGRSRGSTGGSAGQRADPAPRARHGPGATSCPDFSACWLNRDGTF